ncbi:MAG TPA: SsrA-binding protein SmpB [bacterium]|nr:SsrA-binding protein SmpB [bacterium]
MKIVATNRKAFYNYHILDSFEAGMVLKGSEVKSLRLGRVSLRESFAKTEGNEVFIHNLHIAPYSHQRLSGPEPTRPRKLLLHKREIKKLVGLTSQKGLTLVPLKIYFKEGKAKVEIALVKGKKKYDKREKLKKKAVQREMERALKSRR